MATNHARWATYIISHSQFLDWIHFVVGRVELVPYLTATRTPSQYYALQHEYFFQKYLAQVSLKKFLEIHILMEVWKFPMSNLYCLQTKVH